MIAGPEEPEVGPAGGAREGNGSEGGEAAHGLNPKILAMVREQLDRDPPPSTAALYGRATRIDSSVYQLSLRQFHAKYPLRVKRERARERGAERAPEEERAGAGADGADAGGVRDRLRGVFWRLARDVVEADTAEGLVGLVEAMPDRVEEVARIVSSRRRET